MQLLVVWTLAYLVAGWLYVHLDMREPIWNRPAYTRTFRGRWSVRLLWLPATLNRFTAIYLRGIRPWRAAWKYGKSSAFPCWAAFIGLGIIGSSQLLS